METKAKFHIPGWQWILATLVFFVAVLTYQQYILFDIEKSRVLVYEWERIEEQMMRAGGIADFIALFLQQFFLFKVVGAAIMAVLLTTVAMCLNKVYSNAAGRDTSLTEKILCCIPAAFLFVFTEDKIHSISFISGHVAILFSCIGLLVATFLLNKKSVIACIIIPLLILFVGFAAQTAVWPMIASIFIYSLLYKKNYLAAGITILSALLMIGLARYTCLAVTSNELFNPDFFSYRTKTTTIMTWIWAAIVLLTMLPLVFNKFISEKVNNHIAFACVTTVAVIGITCSAYKAYHDEDTMERLRIIHWLDTEDYGPVQEFCMEHLTNTYTSNIFFMIESQNRDLESEVGGILQNGKQLIMGSSTVRIVRRHLMRLYYYLGYVNGAEREAFEYNEPSEGMMVPECLQIIAKTSIIKGEYAVAEKYLNYLDHTLFYSDWAQQYRHFLYNDKAVESDPELGPRRKVNNIESVPQTWTTLPYIINQIAYIAPELPASNYKKAFRRLGEYNKKINNEDIKQSYIQY